MNRKVLRNKKGTKMSEPARSARCDCYNNHNSSSGRCTCRSSRQLDGQWKQGVTDPTRSKGQVAICEDCRKNCPVGEGDAS